MRTSSIKSICWSRTSLQHLWCTSCPSTCLLYPLNQPLNTEQAVLGSFALEPCGANPWDAGGWFRQGGGTQSEEGALKTLGGGWHKAKKRSREKALFQTYIYDFSNKNPLKSTPKAGAKRNEAAGVFREGSQDAQWEHLYLGRRLGRVSGRRAGLASVGYSPALVPRSSPCKPCLGTAPPAASQQAVNPPFPPLLRRRGLCGFRAAEHPGAGAGERLALGTTVLCAARERQLHEAPALNGLLSGSAPLLGRGEAK